MFVGRLTGDEFAIAYPCLNQEELAIVEKQIREKINEPIASQTSPFKRVCHDRRSLVSDHGTEDEKLLKHANLALIEAHSNMFLFECIEPCMDGKALDRLVLENHLHHALKKNELYLVYQPQIDIEGNQIQGVEALIRWQHPKLWSYFPGAIYSDC